MHGTTLHSMSRKRSKNSRWSAQKMIASCICFVSTMHIVFVSNYMKQVPHSSNSFGSDVPVDFFPSEDSGMKLDAISLQKKGLSTNGHHEDLLHKTNSAKATIAFGASKISPSSLSLYAYQTKIFTSANLTLMLMRLSN